MTKEELAKAIYREISEIPCSTSGVIQCAPAVLRDNLSTNLIQEIADKAAEVALKASP